MSKPGHPDENRNLANLTQELVHFGLKTSNASLYLYLLGRDPAPVRTISKDTGLHRVDVYRKLRELEEMGLIEMFLDSPKRYSAVDPDVAISALVTRVESRVRSLQGSASSLESRLRSYRKTNLKEASRPGETVELGAYRLVVGRARYYQEIRNLVKNAQTEVLRIMSANGLRRTFMSGLYKDYAGAKKLGVSLRMISEINSENLGQARKISKLLELRHLDGVHLRFVVVDRATAILSARFDESDMSMKTSADDFLVIEDKRFSDAAGFIFEHLWKAATPAEKFLRGFKKT